MLAITKSWFDARSSKIGVVMRRIEQHVLDVRALDLVAEGVEHELAAAVVLLRPPVVVDRPDVGEAEAQLVEGGAAARRRGGGGAGAVAAAVVPAVVPPGVVSAAPLSSSSPQAASTLPPKKTPAAPAAPILIRRLLPMPVSGTINRVAIEVVVVGRS